MKALLSNCGNTLVSVGGADKNTMVQICNWLLGFSIVIVGFAFGKDLDKGILGERFVFSMAFFGFIISIVSASVSLIYGGYANWNWAKADQIARDYVDYGLRILDPDDAPWTDDQKKRGFGLPAWVLNLSTPTPRYHRLAPIFWIYFVLSLLSMAVHITLMVLAILSRIFNPRVRRSKGA
jgi:hypothetical protein